MSDEDIIELAFFGIEHILVFLGTFSVIAKITPWDDKKLKQDLEQNPTAIKKSLSKLLWAIKILGLTKKGK